MKLRTTLLASTLALMGAASLSAQAAFENLAVDNGTLATAQAVGSIGASGVINVFGLRGTVNLFGAVIVDNSDADFYGFSVAANQIITLRVDTPEGPNFGNDPVVGLFSANGTILKVDDDGGPGYDSLLSFTISAPGTYFAAVSGFDDLNFNGVSDIFELTNDPQFFARTNFQYHLQISATPAPVPVPAAGWLLGSALLGLAARKRKAA